MRAQAERAVVQRVAGELAQAAAVAVVVDAVARVVGVAQAVAVAAVVDALVRVAGVAVAAVEDALVQAAGVAQVADA